MVCSCAVKLLTFVSRTSVSDGRQYLRLTTGLTGSRVVIRVIRGQGMGIRELATSVAQDGISLVLGLVAIPLR